MIQKSETVTSGSAPLERASVQRGDEVARFTKSGVVAATSVGRPQAVHDATSTSTSRGVEETRSSSKELSKRERVRLWMAAAQHFDRITVNPLMMTGQSTIRDTGIPVYVILGQLASGLSVEELIDEFGGDLEREDLVEAIQFAAAIAR